MRTPTGAVLAGVAVIVLGGAGLVRAAVPQTVSGPAPSTSAPIVVSGAYVRAPVPPTDAAAAYFTVFNTTGTDDTLLSVVTGAGQVAVLHTVVNGAMVATANGVVIPAHSRLVLVSGGGHVMIEKLIGHLAAGQSVNMELMFANAGPIDVVAPVVAVGAPAPTGSAAGSAVPSTSTPSSGVTK
ncbi:MAG: copper chaperone PCu(A)C [Jatrophihabitantaceae bacterium]